MSVNVLMVAEKPSICTSIAHAISHGEGMETRGRSPPVHEFHHTFIGKPAFIRVTSVTGHVFSTDFPAKYQNWDAVDPVELFTSPVLHAPEGKGGIVKHLEREARGMDYLVLWLDCDREGENICFEVIQCVQNVMRQPQSFRMPASHAAGGYKQHERHQQTIFRARFSAVTPKDIEKAMQNLVEPNENEAMAVDARQELDLKVGVAFSRFQTRYFQGKYGNLDSAVISYGPCQTPTLGFCVDRYDEIQSFKSRPYYCADVTVEVRGRMLVLSADRGRIFEKNACDALVTQLGQERELVCTDIKTTDSRKSRPTPLNTVELLKLASRNLGIGPQATMRAAEHLYLSGYLSYPRTESTAYPSSFDFREVLQQQRAHPEWGAYASSLLGKGHAAPRQGHDAGDHPPITPVGLALPHELVSSDNQRIYELVCRHFLATISADAIFQCTRAKFSTAQTADAGSGGRPVETFTTRGKKETQAGFLLVYRTCVGLQQQSSVDEEAAELEGGGEAEEGYTAGGLVELPELEMGKGYRVASVKARTGATRAPGYLTESDLISRMEKHGIGTDASIPTHINNITVRNYVTLGPGRTLVPTELGVVLVHGYQRIDPCLVLPDTRAAIEASCDRIAKGVASKAQVLSQALQAFQSKFEHFRLHIGLMDSLFEATFSPLAATGKNMSKCGRCSRYMRYIPMRPQRLHCPTCKETYSLPQNGTVKLYKELRCPLDQFELVLFSLGNTASAQGKSYPLCPCCYSQPPVFLTAKEVQALAATAPGAGVGERAVPATACLKAAAVEALAEAVEDMTLSSANTETAVTDWAKLGVEEHRGVFIKRRVKEGVKDESAGSVAAAITGIGAPPAPVPAPPGQPSQQTPLLPPAPPGLASGDQGGRGVGRGGRGRGREGGGRAQPEQQPSPLMEESPPRKVSAAATAQVHGKTPVSGDYGGEAEEEAVEVVVESMGCNSCLHPTCRQSAAHNMICECPGEDSAGLHCRGSLILDVNSKPNWKLACNQMHCNTLIRFRADIHIITPQPHIPCPECGIRTAAFEFNKLRSPLPNGMTTHVGCVLCDEFLNSLTEVVAGRTVNLLVQRQERYRRGGMGRGGRGRGRGRRGGRGRHVDVKMSFADF